MRFLFAILIINTILYLTQRVEEMKAYFKGRAKSNMFLRIFLLIPVLVGLELIVANPIFAQPCTGGTPSYTLNLSGNDDSVWTSPSVPRAGTCCGGGNCIEFNIILDPGSSGIKLDIISGATPGGALYYSISCGPNQAFGQPICISGTGPFRVTFCKPGANANVYRITAIPKHRITGHATGSAACGVYMKALGFKVDDLTWTSIPSNSTYNNYLSCRSDCDSVFVTPGPSVVYPLTINYKVCGDIIGNCSAATCDTIQVRMVGNPSVVITPDNPTVCYGSGTTVAITANVTGGISPYHYLWSNGDTSRIVTVGAGTYRVAVTDSLGCFVARDTNIVTVYISPNAANAGIDTSICASVSSVRLHGVIQVATGGKWTGGSGTFSPNDTTLNALYFPTVSEKNAGFVNLILTSTGNHSCPAGKDTVRLSINPLPTPIIVGDTIPCSKKTRSYSVTPIASHTCLWTVSGGALLTSNSGNPISVLWGPAGSGSVSIRQTSSFGCQTTVVRNITILPLPGPSTLYHY